MNKEIYKAYLRQRLYESPAPPGPERDAEEANLPIPGSQAEKDKNNADFEAKVKKNREAAAEEDSVKKDDADEKSDTKDNDVHVPKGKRDPRFIPKVGHEGGIRTSGTGMFDGRAVSRSKDYKPSNAKEIGTNEEGTRETDVAYISDKKQKELDASTDAATISRNTSRKERRARQSERKKNAEAKAAADTAIESQRIYTKVGEAMKGLSKGSRDPGSSRDYSKEPKFKRPI